MTMRRLTALALSLALLVGLALPAAAQIATPQTYSVPGAGGVIQWSTASASCANTTQECNFWGVTLPASYFATAPLTNQTPPVSSSLPLHLTMLGRVHSNLSCQSCVNPLSVSINYGGAEATISLANNIILPTGMLNVPVKLDVWLSPIATNTPPGNTTHLMGQLTFGPSAGATSTTLNAQVVGTTRTASAAAINVIWRFGSASSSNAVQFYNRTLVIGQ